MKGEPIWNKFLNNNYLMALEFKEGFVFGRTIRRRICQYKPYKVIDSGGSAVTVSASDYAGEYRFRDPRNTNVDLLYLDSPVNSGYAWILHGSIGVQQQYIRLYLKVPEGKEIPGKFPSADPIRPKTGDDFGYITALESPYETPTDFAEIVIPPLIHIGAEYYNTDSAPHQPVLNLLFCVYWFDVLNAKDKIDKHAELISMIASRKVPAAFLTVGVGDEPLSIPSRIVAEWNVKPLSLDEAIELG